MLDQSHQWLAIGASRKLLTGILGIVHCLPVNNVCPTIGGAVVT
ncbi:hypothetical protein [Vibrio vulnificus]